MRLLFIMEKLIGCKEVLHCKLCIHFGKKNRYLSEVRCMKRIMSFSISNFSRLQMARRASETNSYTSVDNVYTNVDYSQCNFFNVTNLSFSAVSNKQM